MINQRFSRLVAVASTAVVAALLVAVPMSTAQASSAPVTPSITGFSPATGWTTGGGTVTVTGSGLGNTSAAQFIPQASCNTGVSSIAANVISVSNSTVVLTTNPATEGCYAIALTTSTPLGSSGNVSQATATSSTTFQYSTDVDPTDPCVNVMGGWARTSTEFSTHIGGQDSNANPELCSAADYTVDISSANGAPLDWAIDAKNTTFAANVTVQSVSATEVVISLTGVTAAAEWQAAGAVNPLADVQFFVTASSSATGKSDRAPELASGSTVLDAGVAQVGVSPGGSMN